MNNRRKSRFRLNSVDLEYNTLLSYKLKQKFRKNLKRRIKIIIKRKEEDLDLEAQKINEFIRYFEQLNDQEEELEELKKDDNLFEKEDSFLRSVYDEKEQRRLDRLRQLL
jgi:hypothetical protein